MSDLAPDLSAQPASYLLPQLIERRSRLSDLYGERTRIDQAIIGMDMEISHLENALREKYAGENLAYEGRLIRVPGKTEPRSIRYETFRHIA